MSIFDIITLLHSHLDPPQGGTMKQFISKARQTVLLFFTLKFFPLNFNVSFILFLYTQNKYFGVPQFLTKLHASKELRRQLIHCEPFEYWKTFFLSMFSYCMKRKHGKEFEIYCNPLIVKFRNKSPRQMTRQLKKQLRHILSFCVHKLCKESCENLPPSYSNGDGPNLLFSKLLFQLQW